MDASLQNRTELLAREIASQARTIEEVNELMRLMMKSALEQMLDTEMDVHLGRRSASDQADEPAATTRAPAVPPAAEADPPKRSKHNYWPSPVAGGFLE